MKLMSKELARGYLAGLIDGEGTISSKQRRVKITNTDPALIEACVEACGVLGIHCYVYPRGKTRIGTPLFEVVINGIERCAQVLSDVPIRAPKKIARLEEAVIPKYRKLRPEDVADIKFRLREGHGAARRLAREYGVTDGTIWGIKVGRTWAQVAARV